MQLLPPHKCKTTGVVVIGCSVVGQAVHGYPQYVKVDAATAHTLRHELGVKVKRGNVVDKRYLAAEHVAVTLVWGDGLTQREAFALVRGIGAEVVGEWFLLAEAHPDDVGLRRAIKSLSIALDRGYAVAYRTRFCAVIRGVDVPFQLRPGGTLLEMRCHPDARVSFRLGDQWEPLTAEFYDAIDAEWVLGSMDDDLYRLGITRAGLDPMRAHVSRPFTDTERALVEAAQAFHRTIQDGRVIA